jgi:hypothetical protein
MKESSWGFEIPDNLSITWHRGTRSFTEVNRYNERGLDLSYYKSVFTDYAHQIHPIVSGIMFLFACKEAIQDPDHNYQFVLYDHEKLVPENNNNAPLVSKDGKLVKKVIR